MNTENGTINSISLRDVQALGNVDEALAGYFDDAVADASTASGVDERTIRDWVEQELISEQGFRGQALTGPGENSDAVLVAFEDAHLIRSDARRGAQWFELSHDRLVDPVRAGNAAWRTANLAPLQLDAMAWDQQGRPDAMLLSGDALTAGANWAEANEAGLAAVDHEFLDASQEAARGALLMAKASRRTRMLAIVAAIVTVLAIAVGSIAFSLNRESGELRAARATADEQRELAEANAAEASRQRDIAEESAAEASQQRELAEANADEASRQRDIAEENADEASRQRDIAEENADEASLQRDIAEANAADAEANAKLAEENAAEAQANADLAEQNAAEANRQRDLAEANAAEANRQRIAAEANAELAETNAQAAAAAAFLADERAECARGLIDNGTTLLGQSILFDLDAGELDSLRNTADFLINSLPAYFDYDISCLGFG